MYKWLLLLFVGLAWSDFEDDDKFTLPPIHPHLNMTCKIKVAHTRVWYRGEYIPARAFVLPRRLTKQRYQDIGIVVTEPSQPADGTWPSLKPFSEANQTDDNYEWFNELHLEDNRDDFYAVAYALQDKRVPLNYEAAQYQLYALKVTIDMDLCNKITRWDEDSDDYYVPCFHSCSVQEAKHREELCEGYLGAEGGAVVDIKNNILIGVATWGTYAVTLQLPVGMAIPNSDAFYEDYECAVKIRDDQSERVEKGYYVKLCQNKNRRYGV